MKRRSRAGSEPVRARSRKIENTKRLNAQKASLSFRRTLNCIKKARLSAARDPLTETLRPFMTPRVYQRGEVVFHQGDLAKEMFLIATGKFLVTEMDVELPPGRFFGELGFFAPGNRRTMSVECIEGGHVLSLTYEELLKQQPPQAQHRPEGDRQPRAQARERKPCSILLRPRVKPPRFSSAGLRRLRRTG